MKLSDFREEINRLLAEHGDLEVMTFVPNALGKSGFIFGTSIGIAMVDKYGCRSDDGAKVAGVS